MSPRRRTGWGLIQLRIRTGSPADLVSRLVGAGIRLSEVTRTPDGIRFRMPLADFVRVRQAVRGHHERVRIERRLGPGPEVRRVRRRPGLLVGALTAALVLGYVTPRIWIIETVGVPPTDEAAVIQGAMAGGLAPGVLRDNVVTDRVEASILARLSGYTWSGLSIRGVLAIIRVHPFVPPPPPAVTPVLVASRDATVVAVSVYIGQAVVQPGDHVKRGQPLITGVQPPASSGGLGLRSVAEGEVWGAVPTRFEVFQPFRTTELVATGRQFIRTWIAIGPDAVQVAGFGPVPFARYTTTTQEAPIEWQGVGLPARRLAVVYNEVISTEQRYDVKAATRLALRRAQETLSREAPPDRIRDVVYHVARTPTGVRVTVSAAILQNIAVPKTALRDKGGT